MIKKIFFVSAIITAFGVNAQQELSLKQVQSFAVQNAYQIKIAQTDIQIAEKKVKETRAIGLPQISGEVSFNNFLDVPTSMLPANIFNPYAPEDALIPAKFGVDYNLNAGATVSQLIFSGEYIVGLQASKAYVGLSKNQLKKNESTVVEGVTNAYYSIIVAKEAIKTTKQSLESIRKIVQETEEIFKSGFIEETDLDQLNYTLSSLENTLVKSENQYETAKKYLNFQMGQDIATEIELSESLDDVIALINYEDLVSSPDNIKTHIDFMLLNNQKDLMLLNLKREKYTALPSLAVFASHQQVYQDNKFDPIGATTFFPTTLWGLKLTVPMFSSGQQFYRTEQAKLEVEKTEFQLKQVTEGLKIQTESAKSELTIAYNEFKNQKKNLELAQKIQATTLSKYKEGIASSLDLTQAQSQYLQTQGGYINAVFQLLNAKTKLDKALGKYQI